MFGQPSKPSILYFYVQLYPLIMILIEQYVLLENSKIFQIIFITCRKLKINNYLFANFPWFRTIFWVEKMSTTVYVKNKIIKELFCMVLAGPFFLTFLTKSPCAIVKVNECKGFTLIWLFGLPQFYIRVVEFQILPNK